MRTCMKKVLIIAEAGINHNGDIGLAKRLIEVAKDSGADIIKFQTANVNALVSSHADMAEYQKRNIGSQESQKEMLSQLLLPQENFIELSDYCKKVGIQFLSTPFDIESIHFLEPMVPFWKIPSGEITNLPYLIEVAKTNKPVIMSTGMSDMQEIRAATSILRENGTQKLTLLHCNTQYPTPYEDVNLKAMLTLQKEFHVQVGYSDHTPGIEVPIAAVAMGASVIEKHFTLDRTMTGPDHKASLEPDELKSMVKSIRNIEQALGSDTKQISASEQPNRNVARKSIVASCNIKKGEVLTEENITTKRPGSGISPMEWFQVLGTRAVRDFAEDELIER